MAYDSERQVIHLNAFNRVATSDQTAGATAFAKATLLSACTILDFNVIVGATGDTGTSGSYAFVIQYSVDGTGTFTTFGTASVGGLTAINDTVIDGACAVTALDAGDDIRITALAGTVLPAGKITVAGADVLVAQGNVYMP